MTTQKKQLDKANQQAALASQLVAQTRQHRDNFLDRQKTLKDWAAIMSDSKYEIPLALFFVLAVVDFFVSYEIYRDMVGKFIAAPSFCYVLLFGIFIIGLAALASTFLDTSLSKNLYRLAVYNKQHLTYDKDIMDLEAQLMVQRERKTKTVVGIIIAVTVLGMVLGISFQRVFFMEQLENDSALHYTQFDKFLPSVIIVFEIYTGIFLHYFYDRIKTHISYWNNKRLYKKFKAKAVAQDHIAFDLYKNMADQHEIDSLRLSKDLRNVIYRVTFLSKAADDYVNDIDCQVCKIKIHDKGVFKKRYTVTGWTTSNKRTNTVVANEEGEALLEWQENTSLHSIEINGRVFQGPFEANTTNEFDLTEKRHDIYFT